MEANEVKREIFERLDSDRRQAQDAVTAHFETVRRAAWYGDRDEPEKGDRTLDRAWLDEHEALRVKRDEAEDRIRRFLRGEK